MSGPVVDFPGRGTGSHGGDGFAVLEERVKRLEADVTELKGDMKALRADLAELKGTVRMLPGYPGIAVIMSIVGGALLLAQRVLASFTP
jgi:hypothetical protein